MFAQHNVWNRRRMFGRVVAGLLLLSMLTACGGEASEAVVEKEDAAKLLEQSYLLKEEEALLLHEAAKLQEKVGRVFHAAEKLEKRATNPTQMARVEPTINRLLEVADELENESENLVADSAGVREEAAELLLRASRYQAAEILLPGMGGEGTIEGGEGTETDGDGEERSRVEEETHTAERETPERARATPTVPRATPTAERIEPTVEREVITVEPTPVVQQRRATPTTLAPAVVAPAGAPIGLAEIANNSATYVGDTVQEVAKE